MAGSVRGTRRTGLFSEASRPLARRPFWASVSGNGRSDLVGHDAEPLAPGLGKSVDDLGQEAQPLVVLEEPEEAGGFRARAETGQDLAEDGLPLPGVDEGADDRPLEVRVGSEGLEEGADLGPDGRELLLVRDGLGEGLGVFLNEGRALHGDGTACRWIFR